MLQSNQPFQRVDDGIGDGFIGGFLTAGTVGAGLTGYGHHVSGRWSKGHLDNLKSFKAERRALAVVPGDIKEAYDEVKGLNEYKKDTKVHQAYKKAFGSGKRRAIAYGGSVISAGLFGGAVGTGIDAMNG